MAEEVQDHSYRQGVPGWWSNAPRTDSRCCGYGSFHSHGGTQFNARFIMENPIQMDDESWGTPLQSIKAKYGLPMDWGIPSAVGQTMRALNDGVTPSHFYGLIATAKKIARLNPTKLVNMGSILCLFALNRATILSTRLLMKKQIFQGVPTPYKPKGK